MLIPQNTSAAKCMIDVQNYHKGSALRAIGEIFSTIKIERPIVEEPDETNDAHWAEMTSEGVDWVIGPNDSQLMIAGALGKIRINKPAGDNVGIEWKW